jgi:hypothetical protein
MFFELYTSRPTDQEIYKRGKLLQVRVSSQWSCPIMNTLSISCVVAPALSLASLSESIAGYLKKCYHTMSFPERQTMLDKH